MQDCSINVYIGYDRSYPFTIYQNATEQQIRDLTGGTVIAYLRKRDGSTILTKNLRVMGAPTAGQVSLDLTPTETRLVPEGQLLDIELELRQDGAQYPIGRGRVTGIGGRNAD